MNEVNFYQTIPDNFKLGHVEVNDSLIHSIIRQVLNDSNEDIFTISKIQNLVYEKLIRMENISDFHKFFVKKAPGGNFQSFRKSLTPFIRRNLSLERIDSQYLRKIPNRLISFDDSYWFLCADLRDDEVLEQSYEQIVVIERSRRLDIRLVKDTRGNLDSIKWSDFLDCQDVIFDSSDIFLDRIWEENKTCLEGNPSSDSFRHYHPYSFEDEPVFKDRFKKSFEKNPNDAWKNVHALLVKTDSGNVFGLCKERRRDEKHGDKSNYWYLSKWNFEDISNPFQASKRINKINGKKIQIDMAIIFTLMRAFRTHSFPSQLDTNLELPFDKENPIQNLDHWGKVARLISHLGVEDELKCAADNLLHSVYSLAGWVIE